MEGTCLTCRPIPDSWWFDSEPWPGWTGRQDEVDPKQRSTLHPAAKERSIPKPKQRSTPQQRSMPWQNRQPKQRSTLKDQRLMFWESIVNPKGIALSYYALAPNAKARPFCCRSGHSTGAVCLAESCPKMKVTTWAKGARVEHINRCALLATKGDWQPGLQNSDR